MDYQNDINQIRYHGPLDSMGADRLVDLVASLVDEIESLKKRFAELNAEPASKIKVLAFDCFGTVFNMAAIPREEIKAYVDHVNRSKFSEYVFPGNWWQLRAHPDSAVGIHRLQRAGFKCVALSNGSHDLISHISAHNGIGWDKIIDLTKHRVYKPHVAAYRTVEAETGFTPEESMMITANPTFGDVEGSKAIGMACQVIRQINCPDNIVELGKLLGVRY